MYDFGYLLDKDLARSDNAWLFNMLQRQLMSVGSDQLDTNTNYFTIQTYGEDDCFIFDGTNLRMADKSSTYGKVRF